MRGFLVTLVGMGLLGCAAALASIGPLFLVESDHHPHVVLTWPTRGAKEMTLEGDREYLAPNDKTPLGGNIAAYVALGGTRLDYGLVDPRGAAIRVGFYKVDKSKPFFDHLADDAVITIALRGVKFNQPATARPETVLQHLKFEGNTDVLGCAADPNVLATFNTYSNDEDLAGRVSKRNGRLGVLSTDSRASIRFDVDDQGAITLTARIPYALFKHADDPWLRTNPGDFTEPIHFHIEYEAVPTGTPPRENPAKPSPS